MQLSSIVLILLTIKLIICDPLDKKENEQRLNSCGKNMQSKVYMGKDAEQSEAPWSVFFLFKEAIGNSADICTGTVVSSRHILIATHCFAKLDQSKITSGTWIVEGKHDRNNCQKDHYVISDPEILKRMTVQSNKKTIAASPEKVTLVNACLERKANKTAVFTNVTPQFFIDDFAIIDLYEELEFSETVQTVCVAADLSANAVGTTVDYYGFGLNPPKGIAANDVEHDSTGVLRHESVEIVSTTMEDYHFKARDPENETIACFGDSGGGAIADINGRKTIVGVLSQTSCNKPDSREARSVEQYSSVGYYSDIICELTGICKDSSKYEEFHQGYVKEAKPVRENPLKTESETNQNGENIRRGETIIKADPDGAMGINIDLILISCILAIVFF